MSKVSVTMGEVMVEEEHTPWWENGRDYCYKTQAQVEREAFDGRESMGLQYT